MASKCQSAMTASSIEEDSSHNMRLGYKQLFKRVQPGKSINPNVNGDGRTSGVISWSNDGLIWRRCNQLAVLSIGNVRPGSILWRRDGKIW